MSQKKLRIIAGPNGSGKSTFIYHVKKNGYFHFHNYVNADEIQKELTETNSYSLNKFTFVTDKEAFNTFVNESSFKEKIADDILDIICFENNAIKIKLVQKSAYIAALIADFIRTQLLENNQSFEFETVMSHHSKIFFLRKARELGYKIYLYFLCTESPQINKLNVSNRVKQGGHFVPKESIEKRYYNSLSLLKDAIITSDVSFVLQNNLKDFTRIYVIKNNEVIEKNGDIPEWFQHYYLNKLK
jgi:predicted ABC-type ATPase